MKLGINIDRSGTFLFEAPADDNIVTKSYVQKNMLGWLFHTPNIYDYISLLPLEIYVVSCGETDAHTPLIEITEEKAKEFYTSLATCQEKQSVQKVKK